MRGFLVGLGVLIAAGGILRRTQAPDRLGQAGSWVATFIQHAGSPGVAGIPQIRGSLTNAGTTLGQAAAAGAGQLGQILAQQGTEPAQGDQSRQHTAGG